MQYFTVEAASPREALEKMKRQYGQEARILTHKNFRRGGLFGFFAREGVEITGYVPQKIHQKQPQTARPSISEIEEAKKRILAEAKKEQSFQQILKEIQTIRVNLQATNHEYRDAPSGIKKIEEIMHRNDFSKEFLNGIIRRIRHEFSLEDLENFHVLQDSVLDWIGEQIQIYPPLDVNRQEAKAFIIVGPTGVGKTTTIAKLAAIYGIGNDQSSSVKAQGAPPRREPGGRVKIVTIDNYRIAARHQIETYAEIMGIPVFFAETVSEFKKIFTMGDNTDIFLVDTIGKSPRDLTKLAEMKEILDAAGSSGEIHLAISATTKTSDVEEILMQFEPFRYKAIILTKLDETLRIGNVISVLAKMNKPISYIADGQSVPQDIEEASILRLLMNLEGFRSNRERLEARFGKKERITDKYWS